MPLLGRSPITIPQRNIAIYPSQANAILNGSGSGCPAHRRCELVENPLRVRRVRMSLPLVVAGLLVLTLRKAQAARVDTIAHAVVVVLWPKLLACGNQCGQAHDFTVQPAHHQLLHGVSVTPLLPHVFDHRRARSTLWVKLNNVAISELGVPG